MRPWDRNWSPVGDVVFGSVPGALEAASLVDYAALAQLGELMSAQVADRER
jgi:hypothetical protein